MSCFIPRNKITPLLSWHWPTLSFWPCPAMIYVQWPVFPVSLVSCDLLLSLSTVVTIYLTIRGSNEGSRKLSEVLQSREGLFEALLTISTMQRLQVPAELHELLLLALLPAGAAPQPGPLLHPGLVPRPPGAGPAPGQRSESFRHPNGLPASVF